MARKNAIFFLVATACLAQAPAVWQDPSPHIARSITVDADVNLEVLDWGGTGRSVVLLAGLGNTAHVFDDFAPKLTPEYHVYGITRRGFGTSSAPASDYSADRLGDDVLAVIDSLKLDKPVLVGHSIAGEELSSIATRHPERIAGLIYLDAAYAYAFYDSKRGDLDIDVLYAQRKLAKLQSARTDAQDLSKKLAKLREFDSPLDPKWRSFAEKLQSKDLPVLESSLRAARLPLDQPLIQELLLFDLPALARDLKQAEVDASNTPHLPKPPTPTAADQATFETHRAWEVRTQGFATPEAEVRQQFESKPDGGMGKPRAWVTSQHAFEAILAGRQRYTDIREPALAIYASKLDPAEEAQQKAFQTGVPGVKVVVVKRAKHYVFLSNEADVLREMKSFLSRLP